MDAETPARNRPSGSPVRRAVPQAPAIDAVDRETLEERIGHLVVALEHRTVIGQATGILMERYQLTSHAAFATLLRELGLPGSLREMGVTPAEVESVRDGVLRDHSCASNPRPLGRADVERLLSDAH